MIKITVHPKQSFWRTVFKRLGLVWLLGMAWVFVIMWAQTIGDKNLFVLASIVTVVCTIVNVVRGVRLFDSWDWGLEFRSESFSELHSGGETFWWSQLDSASFSDQYVSFRSQLGGHQIDLRPYSVQAQQAIVAVFLEAKQNYGFQMSLNGSSV